MFYVQKTHSQIPSYRDKDADPSNVKMMPQYQVLFLKNDKHQSVWINEVKEIDFEDLMKHLHRGESIFIASKPNQKLETFVSPSA